VPLLLRLWILPGHFKSALERRGSSSGWHGVFGFQEGTRLFDWKMGLRWVHIQTCIPYSFEIWRDENARGARLQERTRSRCLVHHSLVPEMPPKSKAKDSKLKNRNAPSQTVLLGHFIPSVDAANARPKKVPKPAPGTPTNELPTIMYLTSL